MTTTPSERRTPRRYSILREANEVVKSELGRRLYFAGGAMYYMNSDPTKFTIKQKLDLVDELNWTVSMAYPEKEITGRYVLGKYQDESEDNYFIYLSPNDEDQT